MGTTPKSCAARCDDKGFVLAYVYQGSGCSCSCDVECLETPVEDYRCGLPCRQDFNQFCGGLNTSAVYKVRSLNTSRPNSTDGTNQSDDGSDCEPQHYTTLVSFLVISCIIICALVITVVVFYRRLRKVTSSRNLRMYSKKSSIRQINRHATHRPHAVEDGGEHDHQVDAGMVSPTNRGQAPNRALHGSLSNDPQSPAVDDEQISPYEMSFDQGVDQGAIYSPHYSTLERTDVVASNFEGYNDEYTQPGVGLDMRKTTGFACDRDGYLLPGSSLKESTPRHIIP
ncbi:uncharacterized protein LOC105441081 [Strongylocentrotus purpuratus]|uniref:WSC domain-containing protein n=1 Tax=Strongylocentrotus purpuratus TaxID=7668 RepID=A0A7M7NP51_STRPU|nr:uncharacterized protein LOC105441081 [Strongylocentrotus purpuratus]